MRNQFEDVVSGKNEVKLFSENEREEILKDARIPAVALRQSINEAFGQISDKAERNRRVANLPGYIGSGDNGYAFEFVSGDEKYVIKIGVNAGADKGREIEAMNRAEGVPHVPQMVGNIAEADAMVMTFVKGVSMDRADHDAKAPSREDLNQLLSTVKLLQENGLRIDPRASNFLYDPEDGINIVDFGLAGGSMSDLAVQLYHASTGVISRRSMIYPDMEISSIKKKTFSQWLDVIRQNDPKIFEEIKERITNGNIPMPNVVTKYGFGIDLELARSCLEFIEKADVKKD